MSRATKRRCQFGGRVSVLGGCSFLQVSLQSLNQGTTSLQYIDRQITQQAMILIFDDTCYAICAEVPFLDSLDLARQAAVHGARIPRRRLVEILPGARRRNF